MHREEQAYQTEVGNTMNNFQVNASVTSNVTIYPIRYVVRGLLRTAAYAKETRQWPTYNEAVRELRRVHPQREVIT